MHPGLQTTALSLGMPKERHVQVVEPQEFRNWKGEKEHILAHWLGLQRGTMKPQELVGPRICRAPLSTGQKEVILKPALALRGGLGSQDSCL